MYKAYLNRKQLMAKTDAISGEDLTPIHIEDAKGLVCPLPLLRLKRAINPLNIGDILGIESTDEGSWLDFKVYCEKQGHSIINQTENDGVFYYEIRKGERNG